MTRVSLDAEKKVMIEVEFTRDFLEELMSIWPDPESGKIGLSQSSLARGSGVTQSAISNYLKHGEDFRYPKSPELRKLGKFFRIITFVEDWSGYTNNAVALETIKAFLKDFSYKKADK